MIDAVGSDKESFFNGALGDYISKRAQGDHTSLPVDGVHHSLHRRHTLDQRPSGVVPDSSRIAALMEGNRVYGTARRGMNGSGAGVGGWSWSPTLRLRLRLILILTPWCNSWMRVQSFSARLVMLQLAHHIQGSWVFWKRTFCHVCLPNLILTWMGMVTASPRSRRVYLMLTINSGSFNGCVFALFIDDTRK